MFDFFLVLLKEGCQLSPLITRPAIFRTYLRLPWRPLIAIRGNTTYDLNEDYKVVTEKAKTCRITSSLIRGNRKCSKIWVAFVICSGGSALRELGRLCARGHRPDIRVCSRAAERQLRLKCGMCSVQHHTWSEICSVRDSNVQNCPFQKAASNVEIETTVVWRQRAR
jgi:hypothetical protein